jgi:hypothetical protein
MKEKDEDKILDEIRRRVLQIENQQLSKEEKEQIREAHYEALDQITHKLNKSDIEKIARQVREDFERKARQKWVYAGVLLLLLLIAVGAFYYNKSEQKRAELLAQQEEETLQRLTLIESFDDNARGWDILREYEQERYFKDGQYFYTTYTEDWCYWDGITFGFPAAYAVELTTVRSDGLDMGEYGLMLLSNNKNYLTFSLSGSGKTTTNLFQDGKSQSKDAWTEIIAAPSGKVNQQRIEVRNGNYVHTVNGTTAATGSMPPFPIKRLGLRTCKRQTVAFQELKVINLATGAVLLSENFDPPTENLFTPRRNVISYSEISEGRYLLEHNKDNSCAVAYTNYPFERDVNISIKLSFLKGSPNNFGLIIRESNTSETRFYTFEFQSGGKARYTYYEKDDYKRIGNYKNTGLLLKSPEDFVMMKIQFRQGKCSFFINELPIADFALEADFAPNEIGIRACGEQQVAFDDLHIIPVRQ